MSKAIDTMLSVTSPAQTPVPVKANLLSPQAGNDHQRR